MIVYFVILISIIESGAWESQNITPQPLKDGKMQLARMQSREIVRFSFHPKPEDIILRVSVIPCGAAVKWTLTRQLANMGEEVLFRDVNDKSMEYVDLNFKPSYGVLYLYMRPAEIQTSINKKCYGQILNAEVFMTCDTSKWLSYLPDVHIRTVKVLNVSHDSATVFFVPGKSADIFGRWTNIKYCYTLSPFRFIHTFCEWKSLGGDCRNDHSTDGLEINDNQLVNHKYDMEISKCVQYTPNMVLRSLKSNTEYMLSLFAINSRTGASVAYNGVWFKTSHMYTEGQKPGWLIEGTVLAAYINPSRGSFQIFKVPIDHYTQTLMVIVQPCTHFVRVNIYRNGKLVVKQVINELHRFVSEELDNLSVGESVEVKVINNDDGAKVFKIWASPYLQDDPFPHLPIDTSLKTVEALRLCDQITLQWLQSTGAVKYCLFKKKEEEDFFKKLIQERPSVCHTPSQDSQLVKCVHTFSSQSSIGDSIRIAESVVENLEPATTYRFDLFASPFNVTNVQTMSYRTLWVKTKPHC